MGKVFESKERPRLTLATIREIKQACAHLARMEFIARLVGDGETIAGATAIADGLAGRFAFLFFRVDERVLALFDIVRTEAEMRATEAQMEDTVRAICGIYMLEILKLTAIVVG